MRRNNEIKKRIIALLLAVAAMVSSLPIGAVAEGITSVDSSYQPSASEDSAERSVSA